jgi:hypothetical protein
MLTASDFHAHDRADGHCLSFPIRHDRVPTPFVLEPAPALIPKVTWEGVA